MFYICLVTELHLIHNNIITFEGGGGDTICT